jgi:phosphoglycerate dehydrogenase-like enzyme
MNDRMFHLHIENLRAQAPLFHVTPQRFAAAVSESDVDMEELHVTYGWDGDIFGDAMETANCLMGWRFPRGDLAARAPELRWIHVTGAGVEHLLPMDWLPPHVALTNNSGVHARKAGEYIATAVLALNAHIPYFATCKASRSWDRRYGSCIAGKTAVIVGTGNMGAAGARRCKALEMEVIGVNSTGHLVEGFDNVCSVEGLDDVLGLADFLIVALPLTSKTRGLIGAARLDKLPKHCGIVNIGRAAVIDYEALFSRLVDGAIRGAVLDVFDEEPIPADSPIWDVPNLIITPHVSSDDTERYAIDTVKLFLYNYKRFKEDRALVNRVDPARQY